MSVRESVFQEQQVRESYNDLLGTSYEKSTKGDIVIRFKGHKDTFSVIKALLNGVKFSDFEIDFKRSNFSKHDIEFLELEIKIYKKSPFVGYKTLLNETLKLSEGLDKNLVKLSKHGLTESDYNKGTFLYNDLLNFHNIYKLIVVKGILFVNKLNNEMSFVTVEVQPSTIAKGRLQRVKNDFVIKSSVVIGTVDLTSDLSTVVKKEVVKKERESNWFQSFISEFITKYSNVSNLESYLIKSGVLGHSKRGKEMVVNGCQLYLQSKDAIEIKLNKINKLRQLELTF